MARKEREITIKLIENKRINTDRLTRFFANKYSKKDIKQKS